MRDNSVFFNKKGANTDGLGDSNIYIDCQPVNEEGQILGSRRFNRFIIRWKFRTNRCGKTNALCVYIYRSWSSLWNRLWVRENYLKN